MNYFSQYVEHLRFKYGPRAANWLIDLSTYRARRDLKVMRIDETPRKAPAHRIRLFG